MDGEREYDDERTETTQVPAGTFYGLHSGSFLHYMTSTDGASMYTAPRDIPFSQRVPLLPSPRAAPQDQPTASNADDYPFDPEAQVEWHENKLKTLYKQSLGIEDDSLVFRKQLIPDTLSVPRLLAAGFELWLHALITKVHAAA